jgi:hypothetical protein
LVDGEGEKRGLYACLAEASGLPKMKGTSFPLEIDDEVVLFPAVPKFPKGE